MKNNNFEKTKKFIQKNLLLIVVGIILIIAVCIPLFNQGIMCNDELISRMYSMRGAEEFFSHFFNEHIFDKGRALSSPFVTLTMYLGFLSGDDSIFKILQVVSLFFCFISFGFLINKIFNKPYLAIASSIICAAFLPVTFEITAPNAFNCLYNFPFGLLIISLILYIGFLERRSVLSIIFSMILLFISCCHYESFVTFVPVYFLLFFTKGNKNKLSIRFTDCIYPFLVGVIYIGLYIVTAIMYPSQYGGNTIGEFNFVDSLLTILKLGLGSVPCYYVFSSRYQYLFFHYFEFSSFDLVRIIALVLCFFTLIFILFSRGKKDTKYNYKSLIIVLISCPIIGLLPFIPHSLTEAYKEGVLSTSFEAVPSTFFAFFPLSFLISYCFYELFVNIKFSSLKIVTSGLLACCVFPIACMNSVFSNEQNKNYKRLTLIEDFLSSTTVKSFNGMTFKSQDLYETNNALAINDGYWEKFNLINDNDIKIYNDSYVSDADNMIYFADETFYVWAENDVIVFSKVEMPVYAPVPSKDNTKQLCGLFDSYYLDSTSWYIYTFAYNSESDELSVGLLDKYTVGSTLETCQLKEGVYSDLWCSQNVLIKIRSGNIGKIYLKLYTKAVRTGNEKIQVSINNELLDEKNLDDENTSFEISCATNQILLLKISTNFLTETSSNEHRTDLSFKISELYAE